MDPWMQLYIDRARRIREEAEPERLDLEQLRRVTAGDLLARSAELADLNAKETEDTDSARGFARRLLFMPRTAWVRRRVEELGVRLETTQRRERELFEETRDAMADEYGLGLYSQVHTWGHLGAWQRWFEDMGERHEAEWAAEERDEREGTYGARRREIERQYEEYGITDPGRWRAEGCPERWCTACGCAGCCPAPGPASAVCAVCGNRS